MCVVDNDLQVGLLLLLRSSALQRGVDVANGAEEGVGAQQVTGGGHEVGVAVEVVEAVELGDDLLEEAVGVLLVKRSKLGKEDGLVAAGLVGILEVAEQSVGVLRLGVPVNVAEVDVAVASASAHEAVQPGDTFARVAAVGDGRSTDLDLAGVGAHVLSVSGSGSGGRHVGLAGVVGLVEAEHGLGAVGDGLLGIGVPVVGVLRLVAPKHRNELKLGAETVGVGSPVVGPTAATLALSTEKISKETIVVSDTALGTSVTATTIVASGLRS